MVVGMLAIACAPAAAPGEENIQPPVIDEPVVHEPRAVEMDPLFQAYLLRTCDINGDGEIAEDEAIRVKALSPACLGIRSLYGLDLFPNLEDLNSNDNNLTELDLSANPKLIYLELNSNPIATPTVDFSHNPDLVHISASNCGLKTLDVSQNRRLTELHIVENQLETLDVTMLASLRSLHVRVNRLKELDLSCNGEISEIICYENPELKTIWLKKGQMDQIQVFQKDPFTEIKYK